MPKLKAKKAAAPAKVDVRPMAPVPALAADLQTLQRQRAATLKSRNMQANRLTAVVAGTLGYTAGLPEKERRKKFAEADAVIKSVRSGEREHEWAGFINESRAGIEALERHKAALERSMRRLARQLPVAAWVEAPEQSGFGLLFLAIVVGETGDLSNYANPAKVWRRLGCAPFSYGGQTHMGATWRAGKEGKLPAEAWSEYGYSPRRRSIAYLIGEGIVKQNFVCKGTGEASQAMTTNEVLPSSPDHNQNFVAGVTGESQVGTGAAVAGRRATESANGNGTGETAGETDSYSAGPYRSRYDQAKVRAKEAHPDWPALRCHRHAMLLATKLLLKRLWCAWRRGNGDSTCATETAFAAPASAAPASA
jgi:hypothetical protein